MCLPERNTDRRGRSDLMPIWWRGRGWAFLKRALVILLLLAFLAADIFAFIAHALTLVGLRRAIGADLGSDLADQLLVDAAGRDHGRLLGDDADAGRDRIRHVMAEAELQVQDLALHRGAIADALDLQLLGEAVGDAFHQVVHQRARQTPHLRAALGTFAGADLDAMVTHADGDVRHQLDAE